MRPKCDQSAPKVRPECAKSATKVRPKCAYIVIKIESNCVENVAKIQSYELMYSNKNVFKISPWNLAVSRKWRSARSKPGPGCLHSHCAVKFLSVMMLFGGERDGQALNEMWRFHFGKIFILVCVLDLFMRRTFLKEILHRDHLLKFELKWTRKRQKKTHQKGSNTDQNLPKPQNPKTPVIWN